LQCETRGDAPTEAIRGAELSADEASMDRVLDRVLSEIETRGTPAEKFLENLEEGSGGGPREDL
jgi:hypothetical protein